jgi:hypothetical protein
MIDPNDPFLFGIRQGDTSWLNVYDVGNTSTGGDVQLGDGNSADPNDATVITTAAPKNAAFAAQNSDQGDGAVGVFGRSFGSTRSIGVAGETQTGCGVYGIGALGTTIGVAGRSMGAVAVETDPLEKVVGEPVGVLGHSTLGPSVRGHGGSLTTLPQNTPPPPPADAAPGGVFSSGQLQAVPIAEPGFGGVQNVSLDALPQLRLIPSVSAKLPIKGQWGDLYVVVSGDTTIRMDR